MNQIDLITEQYVVTIAQLNARCANLAVQNALLKAEVDLLRNPPKDAPLKSEGGAE